MKQRWSRREVSEIEYTVPVHTGPFEALDLQVEADILILMRLTSTGLEPFGLCLPGQVSPKRIKDELAAGATQVVAVPVKSSTYIDLVRRFQIVDSREIEADVVAKPARSAEEE